MFRSQFYSVMPEGILFKADKKTDEDDWIIYIEASNENMDQEQETIMQKALKGASEYFLSHGVISWDHKHKIKDDPQYIIGEPLQAGFTKSKKTIVKARLYKDVDRAKGVWQAICSKSTRFGASVGGYTLSKNMKTGVIDEVFWDELAITNKPVNDDTMGKVQLVPFNNLVKALTAGGGVDASQFTGGRALIGETLMGVSDQIDPNTRKVDNKVLKSLFSNMLAEIQRGNIGNSDDLASYVVDKGFSGPVALKVLNFLNRGLALTNKYFRNGGNNGR